jgi:hypothetical protein
MRTMIWPDGHMEPPQSADLILTEFTLPPFSRAGRQASMRTFFCSACCENFEATANASTIHDCGRQLYRAWQ